MRSGQAIAATLRILYLLSRAHGAEYLEELLPLSRLRCSRSLLPAHGRASPLPFNRLYDPAPRD